MCTHTHTHTRMHSCAESEEANRSTDSTDKAETAGSGGVTSAPQSLPPLQTLELEGPLMGERTRSVVLPH